MTSPGKRENDEATPSWLLDVLECPVCLEPIIETPIFVCANKEMHSTCLDCYKKLKNDNQPCPVCRKNLTDKRSMRLEKLVESMPKFCCKYKGCGFKNVTSGPVTDHQENECEWRLVPCGKCGKELSTFLLKGHILFFHCQNNVFMELSKARNFHIDLSTVIKHQSVIEVENDDSNFFSNWLLIDETCFIYWLAYQGPKKDAAKYKYTLKIQSRRDVMAGKTNYLYKGTTHCVPCDVSHKEMKRDKEGLMISKKVILAASEANDYNLRLSLTIDLAG